MVSIKGYGLVMFILLAGLIILVNMVIGEGEKEINWSGAYQSSSLTLPWSPWTQVCPSQARCTAEIREGYLFIADYGKEKGDYLYLVYPWDISPEDETIIEARVKLISGFSAIIVSNGVSTEEFRIYPNQITGFYGKTSVNVNTTDNFHTYRIVIKNNDYRVFIDGEPKIDGVGRYNPVVEYGNRNTLEFGAASSGSTGEALWEYIRWATSNTGRSKGLSTVKPTEQPVIKITNFKVEYPASDSFKIIVEATSKNIKIGAYGLRSTFQMSKEEVPPGFLLNNEGYAQPEKLEFIDRGDTDNGPFDEDKREGVYVRTFSVKGWKPGNYPLTFHVHNRPAPGPYIYDGRDFIITITSEGEIKKDDGVKTVKGKNVVIYKEEGAYCAFPRFVKLSEEKDTLLVSFSRKYVASHLHPGTDRKTLVSEDGGLTWSESVIPFILPVWRTTEGKLVYVESGGWRYVTDKTKEELEREGKIAETDRGVTAYLATESKKCISLDNGRTWQTEILNPPDYISGLMNFFDENTYLVTSKRVRLIGLYGFRKGSKKEEVFFWRSVDDGKTWQFIPLLPDGAGEKFHPLSEPALVETRDGKILVVMRNESTDTRERFLYQSFSLDGGLTWSKPEKTPIWGYPANLLRLPDGRILCTYGYRRGPMGIRACISADNGSTWQIDREYILRADGIRGPDLGYPISVRLSDGSIFTCYYLTTEDGITHIAGTRWRLE